MAGIDVDVHRAVAPLHDTAHIFGNYLNINWWRRRESNPRPKMLLVRRLHAYSGSCPGRWAEPLARFSFPQDVRDRRSERTRNGCR